jgi:hypothetical protein
MVLSSIIGVRVMSISVKELAIRRSLNDSEDAFSEIITCLFSKFDEDDKRFLPGLGLEDPELARKSLMNIKAIVWLQ